MKDSEDTSVAGSLSGSTSVWGSTGPLAKVCSRLVNLSVCELEHNEKEINSPLGIPKQKFI